jgi:hypothetical protein
VVDDVINQPKPIVATVTTSQPNFSVATVVRPNAQHLDELLDVNVKNPDTGSILIWDASSGSWIASKEISAPETIINGGVY